MLDLSALKGTEKGFCEFLNWAFPVDSGIVLGKDGSLLGGFFYRGRDLHSSTADERMYVAAQINGALSQLTGGWAVWIEACKSETYSYPSADRSYFPDPVSRMIDDERRQQFQAEGAHFETTYALVVQYTPPTRTKGRILQLIYDDDTGKVVSAASSILRDFKKKLDDLEDMLSGVVTIARMQTETSTDSFGRIRQHDDLVDYLNRSLTGVNATLDLEPGAYLDGVIGGGDVVMGDTPKIGDQYAAVLWIGGLPEFSNPNILDVIDSLPIPMRWSTRFICLDTMEADKKIKAIERKWKQKAFGFFSQLTGSRTSPNQDAIDAAAQAIEARRRSNSGQVATGYFTPVVVLMDPDREVVLDRARIVRQALIERGFMASVETLNAPEAFLGSLAGNPLYNVRLPPIHTDNLADLLPVAGVWTGSATCPCPPPKYPAGSPALLHAATTGATPFRLNLHHYDVGHTLIFGPTGAGKTTLLNTVSMQALRYEGMRIWAFDYKRGMLATFKACGGVHFDIAGPGSHLSFCPLSIVRTQDDLVWANEYIGTLYELQAGVPPTNKQKDAIHTALLNMMSEPDRTLTHFQALVQDQGVRDAVQYYTLSGPLGHLLDAEADGIEYGRLMAFEMEDLLALKEQAAIPVLLYLFKQFERSLTGKPTLLILDEAWIMLGHPTFRAKLHQWLRTLRSKNCAVIMATQSLSDAMRSKLLDVLVEACKTKIALANEEAAIVGTPENPGPADFYKAIGLNDAQIDIIAGATRKRHYYVFTPLGRRLINLNLGPKALAFAGTSDPTDIVRVLELERIYGAGWPMRWLSEKEAGRVALVA